MKKKNNYFINACTQAKHLVIIQLNSLNSINFFVKIFPFVLYDDIPCEVYK